MQYTPRKIGINVLEYVISGKEMPNRVRFFTPLIFADNKMTAKVIARDCSTPNSFAEEIAI